MAVIDADPLVVIHAPGSDAAAARPADSYELAPEVSWHLSDVLQIPEVRRFGRFMAKAAFLGLTASTIGAGYATVESFQTTATTTVGPGVDIEFTPTRDSAITLKLAAGAKIVKPLPPEETHGIGAEVEITNLPNPSKLGLSNLGQDDKQVAIYSSVLGDSDHILSQAKHGSSEHWKGLFEGGTGAALGIELLGYMGMELLGYRLIKQSKESKSGRWSTDQKLFAAAVGACVLLTSLHINVADNGATANARAIPADQLFEGIPFLEGSHLDGTYAEELRPPLTRAAETLRTNTRYFKKLAENERAEILQHPLLQATVGTTVTEMLANGHCEFYMNSIERDVAYQSGASSLWLTSDMVIGGIPTVDKACIDSLAFNFKGLTIFDAEGNHTDPELIEYMRQLGIHVMDGNVIEAAGQRVIGAADTRQSLIGSSATQIGPSYEDVGHALAERACSDPRGDDVIGVPVPAMAMETLEQHCAKLGLAGNRQEKLTWVITAGGLVVPLEEGSNAGGVEDDKLTLGNTLQAPATIVLIKASQSPFEPLYLQVITFNPDTTVHIGPIISLQPQRRTVSSNGRVR